MDCTSCGLTNLLGTLLCILPIILSAFICVEINYLCHECPVYVLPMLYFNLVFSETATIGLPAQNHDFVFPNP